MLSEAGSSGVLPASTGDIVSQVNVLIDQSYSETPLKDSVAYIIVQVIGKDMLWWPK